MIVVVVSCCTNVVVATWLLFCSGVRDCTFVYWSTHYSIIIIITATFHAICLKVSIAACDTYTSLIWPLLLFPVINFLSVHHCRCWLGPRPTMFALFFNSKSWSGTLDQSTEGSREAPNITNINTDTHPGSNSGVKLLSVVNLQKISHKNCLTILFYLCSPDVFPCNSPNNTAYVTGPAKIGHVGS